MKKKTLAIIGCGKLATLIAEAYPQHLQENYTIIAAYSRTKEKAQRIVEQINAQETGAPCAVSASVEELLTLRPDYIIETASPDALKSFAINALQNGSSIVTLSIGAFADAAFYERAAATAQQNGSRIHIASGAIGGLDVLRTASLMGNCTASFHTEKGPNSLKNTPVYEESLQTEQRQVFNGNAIEAIDLFPTRVNVSVAASIASVGPENMRVSMTSTPGFVGDDHRIEIKNDQVHAVVDVYSSTAQIAGWSIVNTLQNIVAPIVF